MPFPQSTRCNVGNALRTGVPSSRDIGRYKQALRRDPCAYCGGDAVTLDHLEPISRGGGSSWDNLTATCNACNAGKHALSLLAFLGVRRFRAGELPCAEQAFHELMAAQDGRRELTEAYQRYTARNWRSIG
jgi:hypothetical protein